MKETFIDLAFYAISALTILGALGVLFLKELLHGAVCLFFSLFGVAMLYVMLGADFLGVSQLLVYAGGVLVLLIFGVFLTSKIKDQTLFFKERKHFWILGLMVSLFLFFIVQAMLKDAQFNPSKESLTSSTAAIGNLLLSKYLLPFELISLLLLFAMIGSVLLVKKELPEGDA